MVNLIIDNKNTSWKYGVLEDAIEKGSSNISLNKVRNDTGDYPLYSAKGFNKKISFFHQHKVYLAIIKDGAGIGRVSKHPAKSSIVATMQYLIPKDGFNIDFIKYFLNGIDFEKHRNGSTIPHIYFKDYKSERFPILPLPEQKRIVSILDRAFEAINQAKANAEQNLKNAKELFESYLNGIFENKGDDWEEKKIKEFGEVQTGSTPPTKDKSNYGNYIPFAKPPHFRQNGKIETGDSMLSEKGLKKGRLFEANSIFMVCIGATIGKTGFSEKPISSNQQINGLTPSKNYYPRFFYYAFISNIVQKQVLKQGKSAQATLPIINKTKWENILVPFPKSIETQKQIVAQLDKLQAETKKLEAIYQQKIDDLEELKKSILQKAFNGEL